MTRSIPKRTAYRKRKPHMAGIDFAYPDSGYAHCECRDCFEIVAKRGLCSECKDAGCEPDSECKAPSAYGAESDV